MKRLAIILLFVAACGGSSTPTKTSIEGAGGNDTDPNPTAEVVTLTDVQQGDAACYLTYTKADGSEETAPGSFVLCPGDEHDATPLIGTRVTLTTEKADMMAASCGGDPECPDTEEVDMVSAVTPAP